MSATDHVADQDAGIDFEALRSAIHEFVPFNRHVGVRIESVAPDEGIASLPAAPEVGNHVGTVHAGALFLVAEAAGGAAFVGAFAHEIAGIRFVAREISIEYLKPATTDVTAIGTLDVQPGEALAEMASSGRATVPAVVEVRDEAGVHVATLRAAYHVKPAAG